MKEYSVDQIKSIINYFEEKGLDSINALGTKTSIISNGVTKYTANDPNIGHFIVFEAQKSKTEISFFFNACILENPIVKATFGSFQLHYNFRENYSEFKIPLSSINVSEIFFIKDNKYEVIEENKFIEINPQGKKRVHSVLTFEGFCLRLNL